MGMIPKTAPIMLLVTPGCDRAVDRYVHDTDTDRFHERITGACPYCLTIGEKLAKAFKQNINGSMLAEAAKERIAALLEAQDERYRPDA